MTVHPPPGDITLEPSDWYIANWRNLPPLVRPPSAPFDRAACLKRLRRVKVHSSGDWGWSAAQIPQSLSPDEAAFWLTALLDSDTAADPAALADQIGSSAKPAPSETTCPNESARRAKGESPRWSPCLRPSMTPGPCRDPGGGRHG